MYGLNMSIGSYGSTQFPYDVRLKFTAYMHPESQVDNFKAGKIVKRKHLIAAVVQPQHRTSSLGHSIHQQAHKSLAHPATHQLRFSS
jgi:hypothetical protein